MCRFAFILFELQFGNAFLNFDKYKFYLTLSLRHICISTSSVGCRQLIVSFKNSLFFCEIQIHLSIEEIHFAVSTNISYFERETCVDLPSSVDCRQLTLRCDLRIPFNQRFCLICPQPNITLATHEWVGGAQYSGALWIFLKLVGRIASGCFMFE